MKSFLFGSSAFITYNFIKFRSNNKTKCSSDHYSKAALCILHPDGKNTAKGHVLFKQESAESKTIIEAKVTGLKKNAKHGFHVHEFGDLSKGCITAGAHFNPDGKQHGGPDDKERHVGDLGNLESNEKGEAHYKIEDDLIHLSGKNSVIGRSCVVHENQDDLGRGGFEDSKTTGHSGGRIACGVIVRCDENKTI